ncbi:hypothetical protein PtA15_3A227 [Puccinia triticina]|uniref:Uncharacterized protein n=1 Tax=Puccinia triticina TaxID=208348 RepID=A0ABY7CFZ9_9BASI|nr:uncharacterized protein PtA15_3A227 [Puccinia triticina]WAQ82862.1 hypothetical protein PtA15_3A227 [Puccinia triticina]
MSIAMAAHDGPAPPTIDEDESPPPEGLQLQPPIRVLPDSNLITLPDLACHLHHLAGDCGPFAPPDHPRSAGAPPPIKADPGCRPPAYAAGLPTLPSSPPTTTTPHPLPLPLLLLLRLPPQKLLAGHPGRGGRGLLRWYRMAREALRCG